jgi:hypothetical protein
MIRAALILGLFALAACGADGAPQPPATKSKTGVTVTGEIQFGVATKF